MKKINFQIETLLNSATDIALDEIERLARKHLSKYPHKLKDFTMAMGTYFFTDKNNNILYDKYRCIELDNFISKWDEHLSLTGNPMYFTAKGKMLTDW